MRDPHSKQVKKKKPEALGLRARSYIGGGGGSNEKGEMMELYFNFKNKEGKTPN